MKKELSKNQKNIVVVAAALVLGILAYAFSRNVLITLLAPPILVALVITYIVLRKSLQKRARVRKMELVFPDFLELVSSNLRAGMTVDKALLLGARKEFAPLDEVIIMLGKDLVTGKKIDQALLEMSERTGSERIQKIITLINSGIRSGGNIAILLEQTATNMRERYFVEKRAASNVLMYVIFIFVAVTIGAPALFGLSNVLVDVLTKLLQNIPSSDSLPANIPFTLTTIALPSSFITIYAIAFIILMSVIGSLVIGLVNKGEEKEGVRYIIPMCAIGITIFLAVKIIAGSQFGVLFG